MDSIYEAIKRMKKRPGMYLGKKSILRLHMFLEGYISSQYDLDKNYNTSFLGFSDFVGEHYGESSNKGWERLILEAVGDDEKAVDVFYELLDTFLKGNYKKQEIYHFQTSLVEYEYFPVRAIHNTNHGNPKRFSNPHVHEIESFPDKSYYFLELFDKNDLSSPYLHLHKGSRDKFENIEEFVYNLKRGGEIEFTFNEGNYSITYPEEKLCLVNIGDEMSEVFFENIDSLLEYEITGNKIVDIITILEPYFRCF